MTSDAKPPLWESRPTLVEAVQWDGTIEARTRIQRIAPDKFNAWPVTAAKLLAGVDGKQGWVDVPVGHWVVRVPDDPSDVWPVDPDYFAAKYRAAPVPPAGDTT